MRIFLSGKVDSVNGKWRDILLGQDVHWASGHPIKRPRWALYTSDHWDDGILAWPVLVKAVQHTHDYVGPYRQVSPFDTDASHMGYFHGIEGPGSHGQMDEDDRKVIVGRCLEAITLSDIVFAYLNTQDCYGTLVELGYAAAHSRFIAIAMSREIIEDVMTDSPPYWFATTLANHIAWPNENETEAEYISRALLVSISAWGASPQRTKATLPLVSITKSFSQIRQWTSDPRVRTEAERMLRHLSP